MENATNPNGMWWLAAFMIVIVSWFFYRYVAPKGWKKDNRTNASDRFITRNLEGGEI